MRSGIGVFLTTFAVLAGRTSTAARSNFSPAGKSSPIEVVATQMARDDLCKAIQFVNVSSRTIVQVQFATMLRGSGSRATEQIAVHYGPIFNVKVAPSARASVGPQGVSFAETVAWARRLGSYQTRLRERLVYVKFDDGEEWQEPVRQEGRR